MTFRSFRWDGEFWTLVRITEWWDDGTPRQLHDIFALKCYLCLRFSTGCAKHWFCGLCDKCRVSVEDCDE